MVKGTGPSSSVQGRSPFLCPFLGLFFPLFEICYGNAVKSSFRLLCEETVRRALKEDRAFQDCTSQVLFENSVRVRATLVARSSGRVCGLPVAEQVFRELDPHVHTRSFVREGERVQPGLRVLEIVGSARAIFAGERTALNFLQHLSGIATLTATFVTQTGGTRARIYDTRKTLPGLRELAKYAVRMGGGTNHRAHLADAILVKDNHLRLLAMTGKPIEQALRRFRGPIEVEAQSMKELKRLLKVSPAVVMLDNMSLSQLRRAVTLVQKLSPATQIEVSGGVRLSMARPIARLQVHRISVGKLTHSAPALDFSLEITSVIQPRSP